MEISAGTKLCGLLGHPVGHTVSPQMHNAAFNFLGLNYVYLAFDVDSGQLARAVRGLKALGALGFNVTIPHKVAIMRLLDKLDDTARDSGAVNTVVFRDDGAVGYNTDVYGVEETLRKVEELRLGRAMIVGAGGAARATATALIRLGFREMIIVNRRLWRAAALARRIRKKGMKVRSAELMDAGKYSRGCTLIVNATPIGMWPHVNGAPLSAREIPEKAVVLDLVYNPPLTRLLEEAEKAGAKAVGGLHPLVEQGAKAFELWTGVRAPREVMWKAAEEALRRWRREG